MLSCLLRPGSRFGKPAYVFRKNGVPVVIYPDRQVRFDDIDPIFDFAGAFVDQASRDLRDQELPYYIFIDYETWWNELELNEIEKWIISNLTGWWAYCGQNEFRFASNEDAAQFKLQWG